MSDPVLIPSSSPVVKHPLQHQQQRQAQGSNTLYESKRPGRRTSDPADVSQKQAASARPKQTKSRNGCITCKLKRLKCDEKKPGCEQCSKRGVTCGGYKKDFKWRPFEEQTVAQVAKQGPAPKPKGNGQHSFPRQSEPEELTSTVGRSEPDMRRTASDSLYSERPSPHRTNLNDRASRTKSDPNVAPAPTKSVQPKRESDSPVQSHPALDGYPGSGGTSGTQSTRNTHTQNRSGRPGGNIIREPFVLSNNQPQRSADGSYAFKTSAGDGLHRQYDFAEAQPSRPHGAFHPTFEQAWHPGQASGFAPYSEYIEPSDPFLNNYASQRSSVDQPIAGFPQPIPYDEGAEEDVEEIFRSEAELQGTRFTYQTQDPFATQGWDPMQWNNPLQSMFQEPQFASGSVEMLVSRFDRRTCGIMSIKDGPTENPWRNLVLPLMHNNGMMFHSLMSMACLHSCKQEPSLLDIGKRHFTLAFNEIQAVSRNAMAANLDVALAGMLALAFGEAWGLTTTTGIDYIKGSKELMYGAIRECRNGVRDAQHIQRLKFLCRTWIYIDVIARLTSTDDDDSCDFETIAAMTTTPMDTSIDPLMGCGCTLFPIVGRVANLVRKVCKTESNSQDIIAHASSLKLELEAWQPSLIEEIPEDETMTIAHSLQTAESYRWATLLYLHQAVPEIPSISSADLAHRALGCLKSIPMSSRSTIVHIYPLLAAGCEAVSAEDREWVQERWASTAARMGIGNVDRCAEVVREVWRRRDEYARKNSKSASPPPISSAMPVFDIGAFADDIPKWAEPFIPEALTGPTMEIPQRPKFPHIARAQPGARSGAVDFCPKTGFVLPEFTVRGRLHWCGVMKEWEWEVLLG